MTLTRNALLVARPNYRVVRIETYNSDNKYEYPYHAFCRDDALTIRQSTPVCLYQNQWYHVKLHKRREPTLGIPAPEIENFDIKYTNPVKDMEDGLREATNTRNSSPQKPTTSPALSSTSLEYEPEGFRDQAIPAQLRNEPFLIAKMVTTTQLQPTPTLQAFQQGKP